MRRIISIICGAFVVTSSAYAQVTVEIGKITCKQYVSYTVANPREISIWLNGYFNGRNGSTVFEPQLLKQNARRLETECFRKENFDLPVMQVIERVLDAAGQNVR